MDLLKSLAIYIKEKSVDPPEIVVEAKAALRRSGFEDFAIFFTDDNKFVLMDLSKDVTKGVVFKDNAVADFRNSDDFEAVTVNAYARYYILKRVSNGEDLQKLKDLFGKKRTWVIHCVYDESGGFEAHTHGMDSYSHPDFRTKTDVGKEEVAYLFNSLCKSVQRGNAFRDGDRIENLYENCDILIEKADDGMFDVSFVERSGIYN